MQMQFEQMKQAYNVYNNYTVPNVFNFNQNIFPQDNFLVNNNQMNFPQRQSVLYPSNINPNCGNFPMMNTMPNNMPNMYMNTLPVMNPQITPQVLPQGFANANLNNLFCNINAKKQMTNNEILALMMNYRASSQ